MAANGATVLAHRLRGGGHRRAGAVLSVDVAAVCRLSPRHPARTVLRGGAGRAAAARAVSSGRARACRVRGWRRRAGPADHGWAMARRSLRGAHALVVL